MWNHGLGENPTTPETLETPTTPGQTLEASIANNLGKCLDPLKSGYSRIENLEKSMSKLKDFLNEYFMVDENWQLKAKDEELMKRGVNISWDGKYYIEMTPRTLSVYWSIVEGLNLRKWFYMFLDKVEEWKPPVYRVYEAQRYISEDPNSEKKPEIEQGNILGKVVGNIKYNENNKNNKFHRL